MIVGRWGWGAGDTRNAIARDPLVKDSILHLRTIGDRQLEWLFRHCRLTIYPSLYEGWGLPIAESLAHGKLCLESGSSAMPDVGGDRLESFSPFSADELLARLTPYLHAARLEASSAQPRDPDRHATAGQASNTTAHHISAIERGRP